MRIKSLKRNVDRKSTVLFKRSIKITLVFELYLLYAYILHSDAEKIASIITRRYPRSTIIPYLPFILSFLSFFFTISAASDSYFYIPINFAPILHIVFKEWKPYSIWCFNCSTNVTINNFFYDFPEEEIGILSTVIQTFHSETCKLDNNGAPPHTSRSSHRFFEWNV